MNFNNYTQLVLNHFSNINEIQLNSLTVKNVYEEKFELEWLATKLKINSFISHINKIDYNSMVDYSSACMKYALKNYKGLPRGFQNGIVSFNLLVSENVSQEAISFVTSRPKKRHSAFEMPIIYDLSTEKIYYYSNTPIWGRIYYKFFREFIEKNFNV